MVSLKTTRVPHRTQTVGVVAIALCGWMTSACFGMRARAVTAPTTLDMPEPPPRVVDVREPETPPPPITLPEEPARNTPTRPRPNPPAAETTRPAAPTPPAEVPVDASKPEEPAKPPPTLQTTPSLREEEMERRIRNVLNQATSDLNRINYQSLTADGKSQYDQAKGLIRQAEDALTLKVKNYPYAGAVADKAATLAAQLGGR